MTERTHPRSSYLMLNENRAHQAFIHVTHSWLFCRSEDWQPEIWVTLILSTMSSEPGAGLVFSWQPFEMWFWCQCTVIEPKHNISIDVEDDMV